MKEGGEKGGLSLRVQNVVFEIGKGTQAQLQKMYAKAIKVWEKPKVQISAMPVSSGLTTQQLAGKSLPKVVMVKSGERQGTGFVFSSNGLVITNRHVVGSNADKEASLEFADGSSAQAKTAMPPCVRISRKPLLHR
jgi:S1-C subfamily serine protease